jgi:hydrogenase 3 maturation protease
MENELFNLLSGSKKVAILGIGAQFLTDDAIGLAIAEKLQLLYHHKKNVKIYMGYTAPENLTGEIKKFHPDSLIMLDAADLGEEPGAVRIVDLTNTDAMSFTTHKLPIKFTAEYLAMETGCKCIMIGVQPKCVTDGCVLTPSVCSAVDKVAGLMKKSLDNLD